MFRSAVIGALLAIVLAFPVAGLFALVFGSPVLLAVGYVYGPAAVGAMMLVVLFFQAIGGWVVLAALGAVAGAVAHEIAKQSRWSETQLLLGLVLIADVAVGFVMTILTIMDRLNRH